MINLPSLTQLQRWSLQWSQIKQFIELGSQVNNVSLVLENQGLFNQGENSLLERVETGNTATGLTIEYETAELKKALSVALDKIGLIPPWADVRCDSGQYKSDDKVIIPLTLRLLDNLLMMKESEYDEFKEADHLYGCVSPLSQVLLSYQASVDDVKKSAYQNALDEYVEVLTERLLEKRDEFVSKIENDESLSEKARVKCTIRTLIKKYMGEMVCGESIAVIDTKMIEKAKAFVDEVVNYNFFIPSHSTIEHNDHLEIQEVVSKCIASYHQEKRAEGYLNDCYDLVFRKADSMSDSDLNMLFQRVSELDSMGRYPLLRSASVSMIRRAYASNQCGGIFSDSSRALSQACRIQSYACLRVLIDNTEDIQLDEVDFENAVQSRDPDVLKVCCTILDLCTISTNMIDQLNTFFESDVIESISSFLFIITMIKCDTQQGLLRSNESRFDMFLRYCIDHKKMLEALIFIACVKGDEELLRKTIGTNAANIDMLIVDYSPLMLACYLGHDSIVQQLIAAKVNVNATNSDGYTALMSVCSYGKDMSNLGENMFTLDFTNYFDNLEAGIALYSSDGHERIAEQLIAAGADINASCNRGDIALMNACYFGRDSIVQQLIAAKVNVNAANGDGKTALIVACDEGYEGIVKMLIDANADVNAANKDGDTAFSIAFERRHESIVIQLIESGADICVVNDFDSLFFSCQQGYERIVEHLIAAGVDVNATNQYDETALIAACEEGHEGVVKMLINVNANINAQDINGYTALIGACDKGHLDTVKTLIKANADTNVIDHDGKTALMYACAQGYDSIVEMLIKANVDINAQDVNDETALIAACEEGHEGVVKMLINVNANINAQDINGYTGLIVACDKGHLDIVKTLIAANADTNVIDYEGKTALMNACEEGYDSIVEMLIKANADINVTDSSGKTAFDFAVESGFAQIATMLHHARFREEVCRMC